MRDTPSSALSLALSRVILVGYDRFVWTRTTSFSSQAQATERAAAFATVLQNTRGCGEVGKAAQQLGAEIVDNDGVPVRSLPPQLQEMMLSMQVGQATPPFGNPEDGVRSLVICGRDDPQTAALPKAE
ncbi:MAG: hypothetical protein M1823_008908, partial [Watsoniomyces obsoletus]